MIFSSPTFRWGCVLFGLALIPRWLWAISDHPRPFSDMEDYYLCAVNLLKGDYLAQSPDRLAYRAPLYPLFLAFGLRILPGDALLMLRLFQSVVGSLSAVFVYAIALRLFQSPAHNHSSSSLVSYSFLFAFLTGLFYALQTYPIFFCSVFMTETFFIVLFLGWILWSLYLDENSSILNWACFSILLGLLALTRPIALFWLPVLAWKIATTIPRHRWIRTGWVPLTAWILPILPWTIRNILIFQSFVFITTNSGINLFIGNNPTFGYYESGYKEVIRREFIKKYGPNEVEEDRLFSRLGWMNIANDPSAAAFRSGWKFFFLFMLDKEPWPWEEYNQGQGFRFIADSVCPLIRWKPWFSLLALAGIAYACKRRLRHGILLGCMVFYTLACLIFFARTRFRMPLEPLLSIYMGIIILSLVEFAVWGYGNWKNGYRWKGNKDS